MAVSPGQRTEEVILDKAAWHRVKRIFREEWWRETEIEACSQNAWKNAKVKAEERKAKGSAPACEICTHAA